MLALDVPAGELTAALVDVASVSGDEDALAGLVADALRRYPLLTVERDQNVVLARTGFGRAQRVLLAGHLDTVPIADNVPSHVDGDLLYGCGTSDMKSGLAVLLRIAHLVGTGALEPRVDVSFVCYDCEEIDADRNGLGRIARERADALDADLAVLLEPTDGVIEGGCQGTLRVVVRTEGVRAHSARSWLGSNAIHAAAPVLTRLAGYRAREVRVDGLDYREGLNAVRIGGGVAGNVIPDACEVTVNFRFAPDRSLDEAQAHVADVFDGFAIEIVDAAPAARPGLDGELARRMSAAIGGAPRAKLGWTDVALFGQLGIAALNYGPGDPNLAHKPDEHVSLARVEDAERALVAFVT